MMNKEIKEQAQKLYSKKEYNLALYTALEPDFGNTEKFLIEESKRNQWFTNFNFCIAIAKDDKLINSVLELPRIDEILYEHFIYNWDSSQNLIPISFQLKIAEKSPDLFVKMLRVSQAFLKNKWYIEENTYKYSQYIQKHTLVWRHLQLQESKLWGKVKGHIEKVVVDNEPSKAFVNMVIIIELEYIKNPSNAHLQFLSQVYNAFISTLLARLPKNYSFNKDLKLELEKVVNNQKVNPKYLSLFKSFANWQGFINSYIDPYCYDLKIEPNDESGIISFNRSSHDYYKWELDGVRYEINRLDYLSEAYEETNKSLHSIFKKTPELPEFAEYELNSRINYVSLQYLLEDFKLNKFPGGNNLDSVRFYQPIIAASNYYSSFLYPRFLTLYQKNKNWFLAYQELKKHNSDLFEMENFPFIFATVEQLYDIHDTQSKIAGDLRTTKKTLASPFSYIGIAGGNFDRFNINYDVFKKPFLVLGEFIFTPTLFFSVQDWFYSITQNALERLNNKRNNKLRKETSFEMESDLKNLFENAGFNAEVFHGHEFSDCEGDVDIKATDGIDTVLIQLKRTKLRLNLEDAYFEYIQTDKKASRQINNVQKHFASTKGKLYKWIVTTSYENTYTTIQDCLKVNYFDLTATLKSFKHLENPSISLLNDRITSDSQIRDVLKYKAVLNPENLDPISFQQYKESGLFEALEPYRNQYEIYNAVNLPLPMAEPQKYREVKFSTDSTTASYVETYNKALDADRIGDYSKAKSLLEECLNQYPNDFDALSAQANVLANMKLFNHALSHFEKAIKINPDDLFVCRNYALTLIEAGQKEKGFKVFTELKEQYWYVDTQLLNPIKNMPPEIIEKIFSM